jgi:hypothetical protein
LGSRRTIDCAECGIKARPDWIVVHANAENVISPFHAQLQKHNVLFLVLRHRVTLFSRNDSKASSNILANHLHQHLDLDRTRCDVPFDHSARPAIGDKREQPNPTRSPGSPWAICITPPPNQVMYSSDAYPGRIYKLSLDGKVLGVFGKSGKQLGEFGWIHEIACPSQNELYVAEILNWRVQKLILEPLQ